MAHIDYNYICTLIGNLSGVPIRLYNGEELVFYHSLALLPKDPLTAYADEVLKIDAHIGYFITPTFHYYGVVSDATHKIVIGPTIQAESNERDLRELALRCDVPHEETEAFLSGMKSIIHMPLDSIMQMLCALNYIMNGETLSLGDITIYDSEQQDLRAQLREEQAAIDMTVDNETRYETEKVHNTLAIEQTIMNFVRKGDTAALLEWTKSAPAVRGGVIASSQPRQLKNTFIVTATLVARAAIRGGMDVNDALALSDSYIRKCELMNSEARITNLQFRMVMDYTERVEKLHVGRNDSKFVLDIANFVQHNIAKPITTEDIAAAMYMSRSRLSTRFKEETGENLSDYIMREKIEEAKHLLTYTDKPISAISAYLCFSSQSHFTRQFKHFTGRTPGDYRDRIRT